MVKVSFNSALGQKDPKKEDERTEALIFDDRDPEPGVQIHQQSRLWRCCKYLGLALMLTGLVLGGAYLFLRSRNFCGVIYMDRDFLVPEEADEGLSSQLRHIQETIRVLEDDEVELINVPVPEFTDSDPADIVHDFSRKLTAYLDLSLNKCYVIPLNTSIVMPPKDFLELLVNIKAGTYLPQSYLIHERMIVTERVDNLEQLGYFINNLCRGRETYRLQRQDTILGMQKREALNCHKIRHFENKFAVETQICEP